MTGRAAGAPLSGVRGVTYDLWRTLVRDRDSARTDELRRERLGALLELHPAEVGRILDDIRTFRHAEWSEHRAPTAALMVQHALAAYGDLPEPALVERVVDCVGAATRDAGVELLPGAMETLAVLADSGVPVGLICDVGITSGAITREMLDSLGLSGVITTVVLSDEIGVPKPYRAPFAAALAALGVPAASAVHVGDLRRKDVAGGATSGVHSIRYRGDHDDAGEGPEAEFVIDRHADLLPLLGL